MLPRINKFTYKGKQRVAIERGPAKGGLLHTQLVPEIGFRTFKPALMMDCKKLGLIATLYHLVRYLRAGDPS
jgi:hypothetical protein